MIHTQSYLAWPNFLATVFLPGQQRVHRVCDSPFIEIFGDGVANRVGIVLEVSPGTSVPPDLLKLTSITVRVRAANGRWLLDMVETTPSLHRQFYHFAVAVAERVVSEGLLAPMAALLELESFSDLIDTTSVLSIERQIGMLGELLFLIMLVEDQKLVALDGWLGPLGEPHDFRCQQIEYEVKTTSSSHRIHTIHGTEQLVPSNNCTLYMISILLGPPGNGASFSLAGKVAELSARFEAEPVRMVQFAAALAKSGYQDLDRVHYARGFVLRRPVALIPVDGTFPSITRSCIQGTLGLLAPRIESLRYDVNVEGLEHEHGTNGFDSVVFG